MRKIDLLLEEGWELCCDTKSYAILSQARESERKIKIGEIIADTQHQICKTTGNVVLKLDETPSDIKTYLSNQHRLPKNWSANSLIAKWINL